MTQPTPISPPAIGPIRLPSPAVLAPLAGYTDHTYRLICRALGAGYCATEVALASSINRSPKVRRKLIHIPDDDHPIAGQIMGREPDAMATAAGHLAAMGCDVIDLNFACPVRKALRRRRGGHMMRDPGAAVAILHAVAGATDLPLTVKLRKSFHENDTTHDAFWRIAETAFDLGAVAICVHGRSVEAVYRGEADWAFIAEVKRHFSDRVIFGSGDLLTAADGVRMLRTTGVDGVAFARGALGNPWIFRQFDALLAGRPAVEPDLAEQRRILEIHYALCLASFGSTRGPRLMNRFGIRYAKTHPRTKAVRTAFINSENGRRIPEILETFYAA